MIDTSLNHFFLNLFWISFINKQKNSEFKKNIFLHFPDFFWCSWLQVGGNQLIQVGGSAGQNGNNIIMMVPGAGTGPRIPLPGHLFIYPSFFSSFFPPFIYPFLLSYILSSYRSYIHPFFHPSFPPFIYPFLLFHLSILSFIYLFLPSYILSSFHSFIHPFAWKRCLCYSLNCCPYYISFLIRVLIERSLSQ